MVIGAISDADDFRIDLELPDALGSLAIADTKGNAVTEVITTPLNFVRASATSRTSAYFDSIRSSASIAGKPTQTANAVRGGWGTAAT